MPPRPDCTETALLLIKLLRRIPRRSQATAAKRLEHWLHSLGSDAWHIRRRLPAKP